MGDSKNELIETKDMSKLIWDARKRKLSEVEKRDIKNQGKDVFKLLLLTGLFVLPFGGIIIVGLVKGGKKVGIQILPSSFK